MKIRFAETDGSLYKEIYGATKKKYLSAIVAKRGFPSAGELLLEGAEHLDSPFVLSGMKEAAEMVQAKMETSPERLVVHGDYDCDGMTSCHIVSMFMYAKYGRKIATYVNDRDEEGYGLTPDVVKKLNTMGFDFVLTVDNGIASIEAAETAKKLGMTLVITDHHEPKRDESGRDILPGADVVVNHKIQNGATKKIDLCGAGTAFFLCRAIDDEIAMRYIDAAGIATVVDMVSMAEKNNRIIVKESLKRIRSGIFSSETLRSFFSATVKTPLSVISEDTYGFTVGPVINAAGRLSKAKKFVDLFTESDTMQEDFEEFVELNKTRKELTSYFFEKIDRVAAEESKKQDFIVVATTGLPEGLLGLIASKIEAKYLKPTFIMTKKGTLLKGSGRARNMDLQILFSHEHKTRIKGGGHTSACGVQIEEKDLPYFMKLLRTIKIEEPEIVVDAELSVDMLTEGLVNEIEALSPFGQEFPRPLFMTSVQNAKGKTKMLAGKHFCYNEGSRQLIMFNAAEVSQIDESMESGVFVGRIGKNVYNGKTTPQMVIDRVISWSGTF